MRRASRVLALAALLHGSLSSPARAQCAMCRTALEGSSETSALARQLNQGILLLLAAPFGVVAGIGLAVTRSRRTSAKGERSRKN